ncbi:hypothetical protein [Aquifex aeolicus]|uniref:hypothetical protein n=1 Tax=Aquifex aeolicus TaxID=63363 RepID=UPI0002E5720A|nr:hypothetical protein [Aquifex aeolicus]
MARRRKAGPKYRKVTLSLPKSTYYILLGIAQGDEKKLNKLIRGIIEDKFAESTVEELQMYLTKPEREHKEEAEETEETEQPATE